MNIHFVDGSDYSAPVDGQILQFGPGNIVLDIPLSLIDDDVFELTETLQASLSFPGGIDTTRVNIDPDLDIANITIFDEDGEYGTEGGEGRKKRVRERGR